MPRPFLVHGVATPVLCSLFALSSPASGQQAAWVEGPAVDQLRVQTWNAATPANAPTTLLPLVRFHTPTLLGRTANGAAETMQPRLLTRHGVPRIELPGGRRLFVYERQDQAGHGLLAVDATGVARIVHESLDQLDRPLAVATDHRHVAFVRDQQLVVVRIDGGTFPGGSRTAVSQLPGDAVPESLVLGPAHAYVAVEVETVGGSDRLLRVPLGGVPVDVAPAAAAPSTIERTFAIAGDGSLVAFLREFDDGHEVWVVGPTGLARALPLPRREYRPSSWVPFGEGGVHLLLNGDGSRLLVTEVQAEHELLIVDTAIGGTVTHVTGETTFAAYIGTHILPYFRGNRLVVASGHAGWLDWYSMQPGAPTPTLNLTQTGSPEPPYLLGSLDVQARFPLANGSALVTDVVGTATRIRRIDPESGSQLLFGDLVDAPRPGVAISGAPDLRVVGQGGERVLRGLDGEVVLVAPPGIGLTPPVVGAGGWRATFAHLASGLGVLVLQFPDGSLSFGAFDLQPPQLAALAGGELMMLGSARLDVWTAGGLRTLGLSPSPIRIALAGDGE